MNKSLRPSRVRALIIAFFLPLASFASLTGIYSVGVDGDFASLKQAFDSVSALGLEGDVLLKVDPGVQTGPFLIGSFQGSNLFQLSIIPVIDNTTLSLVSPDTTAPVLSVSGAKRVNFENLLITSQTASQPAVRIDNNSEQVTFYLSTFYGRTTGRAVEILGPQTNFISLDSCTIRRAAEGIYLNGQSASATGNSVTSCLIDSVLQGVSIINQTKCTVKYCDIRPNAGGGSGASAITIGAQSDADSVFVVANSLSQIRTSSGYAIAIRHNPLTSQAFLQVANNFIFGFQNTGSSQVRAMYLSGGQNRIVNNSILVNDVTATGTAYALYNGLLAPDAKLSLKNNILSNLEATRPAYNLFTLTSAAILESNHNLYYGTGTGYQLGWLQTPFLNLSAWQLGTGQDAKSYQGNPLFVSNSDLHLQNTSALPHQNGEVALDIPLDIDHQARFQPSDIGADEYAYLAPPFDAAILNVAGMPTTFPEYSLLRLEVVVQNRGVQPLANVQLRLSYDDTARAEVLVTLLPSAADTFLLLWSTSERHSSAQLIVEVVLGTDANPIDNALSFDLAVTDQPMNGIYRIGGPNADYTTLNEVSQALTSRGVNGTVILEIEAGLYPESFSLANISGLGPTAQLIVRQSQSSEGVVQISPPSGTEIVRLSAVSYVTLEGLIIQGNGNALEGLRLSNASHHNVIRNCHLLCASQDQSSASALYVSSGCSDNTFEQLVISTAYTGIRFDGNSQISDAGNIVSDCDIRDVRTAIFASWQQNLLIEKCDIATGFPNAPSPCYGIRIGNLSVGDTVRIVNNRLLGATAAGSMTTISCESNSGAVFAANNWIGQFSPTTSGTITALSVQSGATQFYHNSISIGSVNASQIIGVSLNGLTSRAYLLNNIIQIADQNSVSRFVDWTGGTIFADHNLFDAPGANTEFHFAHSSLDGDVQSLSEWTFATGQDSFSVAAPAGFMSESDLHQRPDASGPSNRGVLISDVTFDADGEIRDSLPDIGADEFIFLNSIIDLAVEAVEVPAIPLQSTTTYQILSTFCNVGQQAANNAEAIFYYNELPIDTQSISLGIGAQVELLWSWNTPQTDFAYGILRVEVNILGDAVAANNSLSTSIVVAGAPLTNSVVVGSTDADFTTLAELSEHLKWRGVGTALNILLEPEIHTGPLSFDIIPGVDSAHRVTIQPQTMTGATVTATNSEAVVILRNSSFIEIRDLMIVANSGTSKGVAMNPMSSHNIISNCTIQGISSGNITSVGIEVAGSACVANQIVQCTISGSYIGIQLSGDDASSAENNLVTGNDVFDVYYGVWIDHQVNALVSENDIRPGSSSGPAGACYGVYIVQLGNNGSVRIERNMIHGFLDSSGPRTNRACGIYSAPGISSSVEIVNNFVYGYSQLTTLRSRGIYLSSGNHLIANNSIRLDNAIANNETAGIFVSTGTQNEIYNNCIMSYENNVPSYGLDIETGGDAISDYNCIWGNSPNFSYAGVGSQNYTSLISWQASGQDAQSLDLHARYVSSSDLHIQPTDTAMFAQGIPLPQVAQDFDGDARAAIPCIGADEYQLLTDITPPDALTITTQNGTQATLTWQPVTGATIYNIYGASTLDLLETTPTELGSTSATVWTWDISGDPSTYKFFNVRAE